MMSFICSLAGQAQTFAVKDSEMVNLESRETRGLQSDEDAIIVIQNLSPHQSGANTNRVNYTVNGEDALRTATRKYTLIALAKGDVLKLENLSDGKVQLMYYRSYSILYMAFILLVISVVGLFVAVAYSLTYRTVDYLYNAIFALSVILEIICHFTVYKWDYISFAIFCSLFTLLLFDNRKYRMIGFWLIVLVTYFMAHLWNELPTPTSIAWITVYNRVIAFFCVLKSSINIWKRKHILVSVTGLANVLSIALITDVFQDLVALYPLTQCAYILIFTGALIQRSVKNEQAAQLSRVEVEKKNKAISDLNQNLEIKVAEQTQDIRCLLDNLPQGVLSVGSRGQILKDYSRALADILKTEDIVSSDFKTLVIQPIENLSEDEKDQFYQAILACAGTPLFGFQLNEDKMPGLVYYRERWLQCTYSPLLGSDELIDRINITMLDVTRERSSEAQAEQEKEKLAIIAEIIQVRSHNKHELIDTLRDLLFDIEKVLAKGLTGPNIRNILIALHTVKGLARSFAFKKMSDKIHRAEQIFVELSRDANVFMEVKAKETMAEVREIFHLYEIIHSESLSRKTENESLTIDVEILRAMHIVVQELDPAQFSGGAACKAVTLLQKRLAEFEQPTLTDVIREALVDVPSLAQELGKSIPDIVISESSFRIDGQLERVIKKAFIHIARNALDHGIEAAEERLRAGKPPRGRIAISIENPISKRVKIRISDDGRGLAVQRLKEIGMAAKILRPEAQLEDIAELIFHSGLSTAQQITNISGRGLGMDAVRSFFEQIGGRVYVVPGQLKGPDSMFCSFEIVIELLPPAVQLAS